MTPRLAALLAPLALAACAHAQADFVQRPPERYQATGAAMVVTLPVGQVDGECRRRGSAAAASDVVQACATWSGVLLPDPCARAWAWERFAEIMCHEWAHQLGRWPADHPKF